MQHGRVKKISNMPYLWLMITDNYCKCKKKRYCIVGSNFVAPKVRAMMHVFKIFHIPRDFFFLQSFSSCQH
jgi:hypothetical protein